MRCAADGGWYARDMTPEEDPALIRSFLLGRDAACPGCAYNLRGLASTTCPECQYPLRLQLTRIDRPSRRTFAFVVVLAAVGGVYGGISVLRLITDMAFGRIPLRASGWVIQIAVWSAMYIWLLFLCAIGLVRLHRTRGTDESGSTVARLARRFLWFLLATFVLGLGANLARFFGWL